MGKLLCRVLGHKKQTVAKEVIWGVVDLESNCPRCKGHWTSTVRGVVGFNSIAVLPYGNPAKEQSDMDILKWFYWWGGRSQSFQGDSKDER
jgi:hypothetical protein